MEAGSGWEALPEAQDWSGDLPGGPGVVERPSRWVGSGWEALPEGREWSEGPFSGPRVVGRPSQRVGSDPIQFRRVGRPT